MDKAIKYLGIGITDKKSLLLIKSQFELNCLSELKFRIIYDTLVN